MRLIYSPALLPWIMIFNLANQSVSCSLNRLARPQMAALWLACISIGCLTLPVAAQRPDSVATDCFRSAAEVAAVIREIEGKVQKLKGTDDAEEAKRLIDFVVNLGEPTGYAPAVVKRYVVAELPAALFVVAQKLKFRAIFRASALMALRTINASDADLKTGIHIASAEAGPDRDYLLSRSESLVQWLRSSSRATREAEALRPRSCAAEVAALTYLQSARIRVGVDAMLTQVTEGKVRAVEALLDAGVPVDPRSGLMPDAHVFTYATMASCADPMPHNTMAQNAVLSLLVARGVSINQRDGAGNTALHFAARFCPVEMVMHLVGLGAAVNQRNAADFTPLSGALLLGRWEVAEFLVANGARLSNAAIEALFFDLPIDPAQRALVDRARQPN